MVFQDMRATNWKVLTIGAALLLVAAASALAQGMQPYSIEMFGVFRNLMMTGDFSPKVRMEDAMAKHPPLALAQWQIRSAKSRSMMAS